MSRHDHHHHEEDVEEEIETPSFFPARIYEGEWCTSLPRGFDAVTLQLDGRVQSEIDWKEAKTQAEQAVDQGYRLMWNIDLGLFDRLPHFLSHQGQFLTLTLALEHFRDSLWKDFKLHTVGVSLFRGSADFSHRFQWDSQQEESFLHWLQGINVPHLTHLPFSKIALEEEGKKYLSLYCRDVAVEYISLLASRLPDSLPVYLFLDLGDCHWPSRTEMQLFNPERFDRLNLALKGSHLPWQAMGWHHPTVKGYSGMNSATLPEKHPITVAICVPPLHVVHPEPYLKLEQAIDILKKKNIPFKFIPESHLTAEWDGLDYLIYSPAGLSPQGKRKFQGFCAAGGTAISTDHLMGFSQEMTLHDSAL